MCFVKNKQIFKILKNNFKPSILSPNNPDKRLAPRTRVLKYPFNASFRVFHLEALIRHSNPTCYHQHFCPGGKGAWSQCLKLQASGPQQEISLLGDWTCFCPKSPGEETASPCPSTLSSALATQVNEKLRIQQTCFFFCFTFMVCSLVSLMLKWKCQSMLVCPH